MGVFMRSSIVLSSIILCTTMAPFNLTASGDEKCNLTLSRIAAPLVSRDASRDTPVLGLDPLVQDIHRNILKGNHVIIEGPRGSGKTSAVKAFAQALRDNQLDQKLLGAEVIRFDWKTYASVPESVTGDQAQTHLTTLQQLEARWRELKSKGEQPVIYIDDINQLFVPEPGKALPFQDKIVDMLKRLANEKVIQIIGEAGGPIPASADKFLADRFGRVQFKELSDDQRLPILRQAIEQLKAKYPGVKFSKESVLKILESSRSLGTAGMLEIADEAALQSYLSRADRVERIKVRGSQILRFKDNLDFLRGTNDLDLTNRFSLELSKLESEQKKDVEQRDKELELIKEMDILTSDLGKLSSEEEALIRARGDRDKLSKLQDELSQKRIRLEELQKLLADSRSEHRVVSLEVDAQTVTDVAKRVRRQINEAANADKPWRLIEKPSVAWDSVKGMTEAKQQIERVIDALKYPDLTEMILQGQSGNSILLYGPPGNGKTFLATAAAALLHAPIMILETNKIFSKWQGESEQNIRAFFEEVRRLSELAKEKHAFVFMDEIDSLARDRSLSLGGSESRTAVLNIMLQALQGFEGKMSNVVLMAATNKPWELDPAFTRAGRFDNKVYIGPPEKPARVALIEKAVSGLQLPGNSSEIINSLAERMDGWSGAEIAEGFGRSLRSRLFNEAIRLRRAEELKVGEIPPVTAEMIESVFKDLSRTYPEVSKDQIKPYEDYSNRRARNEEQARNVEPGSLTSESGQ